METVHEQVLHRFLCVKCQIDITWEREGGRGREREGERGREKKREKGEGRRRGKREGGREREREREEGKK